MTSYFLDIVLLENRQSGLALKHYTRKGVEAFTVRTTNPKFWWRRLPLASGHCAYQNVSTGCLLGHYVDKGMYMCNRDAYNEHCQWLELEVGVSGFVALQNRATGMVLDHYCELVVHADSEHEDGRPSQHWQLVSVRRTQRYERQSSTAIVAAFDENRKYDIVAFRNRETGQVLNHSASSDLIEGEALTSTATVSKSCQWYRIPICDSTYAYRNVRSAKVLEHCKEDDGDKTTVQALTTITHLASHQWQEVNITTGDEDGDRSFITLQNRHSGRKLHHCHETPTHMCEHVGRGGWDSDPKFHWELVWVHRHPNYLIIDDNRASPWMIWWSENIVRTLTRSDIEKSSYTPPDWSYLQFGAKQK